MYNKHNVTIPQSPLSLLANVMLSHSFAYRMQKPLSSATQTAFVGMLNDWYMPGYVVSGYGGVSWHTVFC